TRAVPGWDIRVVDDRGAEVKRRETGAVVARLPLPPGCLPTLWNADQRYKDSYLKAFPGYYQTGDAGFLDADGYLYVMARTDDVINVAGHRLSTGAMEEVLAAHPDVAECAVIGAADALKGQVPVGFLVRKAGVKRDSAAIPPRRSRSMARTIASRRSLSRASSPGKAPNRIRFKPGIRQKATSATRPPFSRSSWPSSRTMES